MKKTVIYSLFVVALLAVSMVPSVWATIMSIYGDTIDYCTLTNSTIGSTNTITAALTGNVTGNLNGNVATTAGQDTTIGNTTGAVSMLTDDGILTLTQATDNVYQISDGTVLLLDIDLGTTDLITLGDPGDNLTLDGAAIAVNGATSVALGDGTPTVAINSSDWDISTTGEITNCTLTRAQLVQEDAQVYTVPVYSLRAADGAALGIADTQGSGDHYLSYSAGVWKLMGNSPSSSDETDVSSFQFSLPPEYVAAETVTIRVNAEYTADGDEKTVDLNVYEINPTDATKGSDICDTAAITLTDTDAACDFTVTPTDLVPGDLLCVVLTTVFGDDNGSVGEAEVNSVQALLDIKG